MTDPGRRLPLLLRIAVPWLGGLLIAVLAGRIGGPVAALAGGVLTVGLALVTIRLLDRHSWPDAGLRPGRSAGSQLLLGFLVWAVPGAAMIIIGALAGWLRFAADLTPVLLGVIGLQLVVAGLAQALPQELIFRSAIFGSLGERFGDWPLILLQALLYGGFLFLISRDPLNAGFGIGVGIAFGYLRAITGSVWAAVGMHVAYRLATGLIGSTELGLVSAAPTVWPAMLIFGLVPFAVGLTAAETLVRIVPGLSRPGPPKATVTAAG